MADLARAFDGALHDFLDWEAAQPERWELLNGESRMMTGGTGAHSLIKINLTSMFRRALKGSGCRPYDSDMKVVTPDRNVFYPDLSVSCGPPLLTETALYDPNLVVEVLSPSSAADDYGRKRRSYQSIPSLRHYMIVAQDCAQVELYTRYGKDWLLQMAEGLEATIRLEALEIDLALAEIFDGILAESPDVVEQA